MEESQILLVSSGAHRNCQQTAGSVLSLVALLPKEHVQFEGPTTSFEDKTTSSSSNSFRHFCTTCGAPVQTVSPARANLAIVKMGLFAKSDAWGSQIQAHQLEIFTKNKKEWESLVDGAKNTPAAVPA